MAVNDDATAAVADVVAVNDDATAAVADVVAVNDDATAAVADAVAVMFVLLKKHEKQINNVSTRKQIITVNH